MNELHDPKLHLFVDDHGLASKKNLERVIGRPKKHGLPVVKMDRPWESPWVYAWGSVFRDPESEKLRMWYGTSGYGQTGSVARTCYAESYDGINWRKPDLGLYSFNGHPRTNTMLAAEATNKWMNIPEALKLWEKADIKYLKPGKSLNDYVTHFDGENVIYDPNETDPNKRYKLVSCFWPRIADGNYYHMMLTSPDGINWDPKPVDMNLKVNDGTKVHWDPIRKIWMLTYLQSKKLNSIEWGEHNIRTYGLAESPDLLNWTKLKPPFELDEADDYGRILQGHFHMQFVYGDQYIGLASMIHTTEGWCQSYLTSSRDGRSYERNLRREAFLVIGSDTEFDADSAETAIGEPIIIGDDMYIYYCGRARRDWTFSAATGSIGLLTMKRDRFAGLANGGWFNRNCNNLVSNDGEIVTNPVEVTGPKLYVNVRTRQVDDPWGVPWGNIRVELLDDSLTPIPGFTLDDSIPYRGDEVRALMKWKNGDSVASLLGKKVSVRITVNMATLYAYTFK